MENFCTIPDAPICVLEVKEIVKNKYVTVYFDKIRFSNGTEGTHLRVDEPTNGCVVIVLDEYKRIYIHKVYHYSANSFCLEFVRGYGEPGEIAKETAIRELTEEGNFKFRLLEEPTLLGHIRPNSTILMSRIAVYLVKVAITKERVKPIDDVEMPCDGNWITRNNLEKLIKDGKIEDSFSLAAYVLAKSKDCM